MTTHFLECIKIENGHFINLYAHIKRIINTIKEVYNIDYNIVLNNNIIPKEYRKGIVKCRILYNKYDYKIEYAIYKQKVINSLKLVEAPPCLDYHLKYANRNIINNLLQLKEGCDDVLIVQNKLITDTSFSNVVFFDGSMYYTPTTYLLNGTKRQSLLQNGIIQEIKIGVNDIINFKSIFLINAMLDISNGISVNNII